MTEQRQTFPAMLEQVEAACDFVAMAAQAAGLSEDAVYHCRLSVEEICTNVIEHGYRGHNAGSQIEIVCRLFPDHFETTVIDDAPEFDPLSLPPPDPSTPLWERQGGGWGVYFVRKFMDRVIYSYQQGRNHLTMVKVL